MLDEDELDFEENEDINTEDTDYVNSEETILELKSEHVMPKGFYFDEDYFADLVLNHYLPSIKKDENGNIIGSDKTLEKEVLANMLLIVNAVINKYGIWRFEKFEILQSEGLAECWRSLPTFDPSRKKKFFHFLSLVTKYHLINLTKKDKEMRETADIAIQPDLEGRYNVGNEFFFEDMEADVVKNSPRMLSKTQYEKECFFEEDKRSFDDDPMERKETLELVRAYYKIPNRSIAKNLFKLIVALSKSNSNLAMAEKEDKDDEF